MTGPATDLLFQLHTGVRPGDREGFLGEVLLQVHFEGA